MLLFYIFHVGVAHVRESVLHCCSAHFLLRSSFGKSSRRCLVLSDACFGGENLLWCVRWRRKRRLDAVVRFSRLQRRLSHVLSQSSDAQGAGRRMVVSAARWIKRSNCWSKARNRSLDFALWRAYAGDFLLLLVGSFSRKNTKPRSGFAFFLVQEVEACRAENPLASPAQWHQLLVDKWAALSKDAKHQFEILAEEDAERYKRDFKEYLANLKEATKRKKKANPSSKKKKAATLKRVDPPVEELGERKSSVGSLKKPVKKRKIVEEETKVHEENKMESKMEEEKKAESKMEEEKKKMEEEKEEKVQVDNSSLVMGEVAVEAARDESVPVEGASIQTSAQVAETEQIRLTAQRTDSSE